MIKMYITLTIKYKKYNKEYDIEVHNDNKIIDAIKIVNENFKIDIALENIEFVKSMKNNSFIQSSLTFKEGNVWTGDILEIK